jgi:hypothetical protein
VRRLPRISGSYLGRATRRRSEFKVRWSREGMSRVGVAWAVAGINGVRLEVLAEAACANTVKTFGLGGG